jgi:uncharacterized protein YndB with AHSA1/START domain
VKDIVRDLYYPHPPERVWRALTDPVLLATWLMETDDFVPVRGCRFRFRTKPAPGFDGIVHCEVVEADAPTRLVYTWASGKMREHPTTVSWTLQHEANGTRLVLRHSGFRGLSGFLLRSMLGSGWGRKLREYLGQVLDRLATAADDVTRADVSSVMVCDPPDERR